MPPESRTEHAPNALLSFCRQTTQTLRQSYASPHRRSSPTSASSPPTLSPAIWLFERQPASYPDSCSGLDKHILRRTELRRVLKTEDWSCPPEDNHRSADWTSLEREIFSKVFVVTVWHLNIFTVFQCFFYFLLKKQKNKIPKKQQQATTCSLCLMTT